MRAFVTGGHGFVGPWLSRHLSAEGDELVLSDPSLDIGDGEGLRQAMAAARPDVVYHLAAQSSVGESWQAPAETWRVNALGTVQVLGAVQDSCPGARVVLVSSVEVYGAVAPSDLPITETAPFRPATPYAASKVAAEMAGLQAYLGRRLDVIRARPFNHTGPGQTDRFFVPSMARQIVEGCRSGDTELRTGNLTVCRDILDVRDVVRAYRLLALRGRPGEAYNVCSGRSVPLRQVLEHLLTAAGCTMTPVVDPQRLRPVDLPDLRGDPTHLRQDTGWEPAIDLEVTLADVIGYWRGQAAA
jgi:GDP-4-dehydro-6-deoxy-D-mannose reductase